jgi:hypothetical protein
MLIRKPPSIAPTSNSSGTVSSKRCTRRCWQQAPGHRSSRTSTTGSSTKLCGA